MAWMFQVLEVSPSGYYAWLRRPESQRSRDDRRLLIEIRAIHHQSRRTYGSPRMYRELRERKYECGRHRVARLMRQDGRVLGAMGPDVDRRMMGGALG